METIPWYKSAIIRQQVVQIIVAVLAFVGVTTDVDWSQTVEALFAGIAAAVAVWTIITRYFKPAPNMTVKAAIKEQELIRSGEIPQQKMANSQRGHAFPMFMLLLGLAAWIAVFFVGGCTGTVTTYKNARTLSDTAYIVAEHYAAVVKQAADIAENPATPENVKASLQAADRAVKPFVLGDDAANRPGLRDLAEMYDQVRNAQTEADLQNAINSAVLELSRFINAVKAARSSNVTLSPESRPDRYAGGCLSLGIAGSAAIGRCAVRFG